MGCNCKKNANSTPRQTSRVISAPKGRGVNNGKTISRVKRIMRRTIR